MKRAKLAVAGITVAGSALVGTRPANAVPDWAVNGGMATAGAAVASMVVRGNRTSDKPLTPTIDAAASVTETQHAADVHAINDLVKELETMRETEPAGDALLPELVNVDMSVESPEVREKKLGTSMFPFCCCVSGTG